MRLLSLSTIGLLAGLATAAPVYKDDKITTASKDFTTGTTNITTAAVPQNGGNPDYTCYYGTWQNYPPESQWIDFETMWSIAQPVIRHGCTNLNIGRPDDTDQEINYIKNAIREVAPASGVDPRFILATIVQESIGCVWAGATTSHDGVRNPGLMQSHQGDSYDPADSKGSITRMIRDGAQGTSSGDGLAQGMKQYGNIYEAARHYNSGTVVQGNLNDATGATGTYVNDIANRMTGWNGITRKTC